MKKFFAALSALFLVACQAPANQPASTTSQAATLEKVTLVLDYTPNTNHTGIYVAQAKGYFKEAGLEVTIVQPPENGAELTVASGQAQFGIGYQDLTAAAFAKNLPITSIAAVLAHNTSGLLSLKEDGITSPKGMENKVYATWDLPIERAMIEKVVKDDGGDFSKVTMVPNSVTDIVSALNTTIDVVWAYEGWDKTVTDLKGIATNYVAFRDLNPVFDYYTPIIFAHNDVIKNNPALVQKFVDALTKGYTFASQNPQESADILLAAAPELDKELVYASQKFLSTQYIDAGKPWGYVDPERWNAFYKWLNDNNLVERKLEVNEGFTNDFIKGK